jgi:type II secretory pathway component PulM
MLTSARWEVTVSNPAFLDKIQGKIQKPEAITNLQNKISEKWNGLQSRERIMLVGMVIALSLMGGYIPVSMAYQKLEQQQAEIDEFRKSLDYLADNQSMYQQNMAKKEAMRKKLINADSKIASKLTSMASSIGFDVTVTPKDPHKTSDDSGAEEQEIEVTLKNVEYAKFLEYLVQIHKLETPIFMRHINMNRTSNLSNSDTKMTVSITLISYRLKEQNET